MAAAADASLAPRLRRRRCGLHALRAGRDPHPGRLRLRLADRRPDVRRRGARLPRGQAGRAVRRRGGQAARQAARGDRAHPRGRVRRERPEMPPAGQPRPAAGGDRVLRAAPLEADRADPAEADRDARQLRDQAALRQAERHHAGARPRAAGRARREPGHPLSDLPSGGGALHPADAPGARGGLRADPGAARRGSARRSRWCRRPSPSRRPSSRPSSASSEPRRCPTPWCQTPLRRCRPSRAHPRRPRPSPPSWRACSRPATSSPSPASSGRARRPSCAAPPGRSASPGRSRARPSRSATATTRRCPSPTSTCTASPGSIPEEWGDLEPYFDGTIAFVEWPEHGGDWLPAARAVVTLEHVDESHRSVRIDSDLGL